MKKFFQLAILLITFVTVAQVNFEGRIVTAQTVSSDDPQIQSQLALMGIMTTTQYIKASSSRSEIKSPMVGEITTIYAGDTKELLVLNNNPMMGKTYTKVSQEEIDANNAAANVSIEKGTETKTILGYKCKQYFMTTEANGATVKMEMFVTDEIPLAVTSQNIAYASKIKGTPLYVTGKVNQMGTELTIVNEVTEIVKEPVSDDKFDMTVPEGYKSTEATKQ